MIGSSGSAVGRRLRGIVPYAAALAGVSAGLVQALPAVAQAQTTSAGQAERSAVAFVNVHYGGRCRARVLKVEADVEHGVPVYDIRTAAPDGTVFVVHVRRSNSRVLWASRAESQGGGCRAGASRVQRGANG